MTTRKLVLCIALGALVLRAESARAQAQSGLAGVVKDTSGAALPGVTVEASSPALIEKVRSVVTDGEGLYRIVDLRPGSYSITFSLPGFNTVRREGIELTVAFTATVNVELPVGSLEETITVAGAAPMVDTASVQGQKVMTADVIAALPTGQRSFQNLGALIPGVISSGQDVGGTAVGFATLAVHGSRGGEMQQLHDGMPYTLGSGRGGAQYGMHLNDGAVQETSLTISGQDAESEVGGVRANMIPKEGGNQFSFMAYGTYGNNSMQATNLTDDLKKRGLTSTDEINKTWDSNVSVGGPLMKDRLWFYGSYRNWGASQNLGGLYYNLTPTAFVYTPDFSRPATDDFKEGSETLRLTWQASPRNKIGLQYYINQDDTAHYYVNNRNSSPEAIQKKNSNPMYMAQASWNSPVNNKLLFTANSLILVRDWPTFNQPDVPKDRESVTELRTGFVFRNVPTWAHNLSHAYNYKATANYVTGTHTAKVGFQWTNSDAWETLEVGGGARTLQLLDGVPRQITEYATPIEYNERMKALWALFAQDQWAVKRLTLNLGIRYDYQNAYVPEQHLGAGTFVPARDFAPVNDVPLWKDWSPRFGAIYDVFGTSKTAIKFSLGRFVEAPGIRQYARVANPVSSTVLSATRPWTDSNGDFVPQETELGALSNSTFGQQVVRTQYGEGVTNIRGFNWETSLGIQHELFSHVALDVGYYRRSYGNFRVNDNTLVTPADYDTYCITAPTDPRLPNGGGYQVCGLADVKPVKRGLVNTVISDAGDFGTQAEVFDGFDVGVNLRLPAGARLQGGTSTGRTRLNKCFVVDSPQELQFCDVRPPMQTQLKLIGVYPLPWWGIQTGASFQHIPGPEITASYTATNAEIRPSLGRDLTAGAAGTATIALVSPGTLYADALNQLDLRASKIFSMGKNRLQLNFDLYNAANASSVLTLNNAYSLAAWQRPQKILQGRLFKFGAQFSF